MTNALKASVIAALNAGLGLAVVFGVPLSEVQIGAIMTFANALLAVWVGLTYKYSPMRIPDQPGLEDAGEVSPTYR